MTFSMSTGQLPRVHATGPQAVAIVDAISALLAAQTPPVAAADHYTIPQLDCVDIERTPLPPYGHRCQLTLAAADGTTTNVATAIPSEPARALHDALQAAGVSVCSAGFHGDQVSVANLQASAGVVDLDDGSTHRTVPSPNVTLQGDDARAVVDAVASAGIDECGSETKVSIVCNTTETSDHSPTCGALWTRLASVGSSSLVPACGELISHDSSLDPAASARVWNALLSAARAGGLAPPDGAIDQTTLVNASYFSWDGTTLGVSLTVDDATPPPPGP